MSLMIFCNGIFGSKYHLGRYCYAIYFNDLNWCYFGGEMRTLWVLMCLGRDLSDFFSGNFRLLCAEVGLMISICVGHLYVQAVADIIRTTLGPRSMLKMLLDSAGGNISAFALTYI